MNKFILFFLFSCTQTIEQAQLIQSVQVLEKAEYVVLNRPEFPDDFHQIEYIGNWVHMNNVNPDGSIQTGSFASSESDTAKFGFWGYGIQIRTELMEHHEAYKVFIDGKFIQSVNVKNAVNTTHNLTYSFMELKPLTPNDHNHVLELVPDGGYFVLNTLTIHYYVDPTPDLPCDSTAINWIDSIRWIEKDTTIISYKDSTILNIKDSTVINYDTLESRIDTLYLYDTTYITKLVIDTVYLQPKIFIKADSLIFELN